MIEIRKIVSFPFFFYYILFAEFLGTSTFIGLKLICSEHCFWFFLHPVFIAMFYHKCLLLLNLIKAVVETKL